MKSSSRKSHDEQEESNGEVDVDEAHEDSIASKVTGAEDIESQTPEVAERRSFPKQTEKSKSFNDRHLAKKSAYLDEASLPNVDAPHSEINRKSRRSSSKSDVEFEPSSLPSPREAKPREPGSLPKYDFTFRCVERAEKRKEFFTKLEEKIHAKEAEKSTLEATIKEKEETEIKMLRKSLIFKGNPMPNFYQEPPPPKPQLKKIPTTKPKSPKLSTRRRTPATSDSDDPTSCTARSGRLSLDGKVTTNKGSRGISPVKEKNTVRKSLSNSTSEKSSLPLQENTPDNIQQKCTLNTEPNLTLTSDEVQTAEAPTSSTLADEKHENPDSAAAAQSTTIQNQSK